MGTNCAPLVADFFLYCYERDFMDSLNHDNQADVIEASNSTSRYLDDLLNIDNPYFEGMVNQIYPPELQLNKANTTDTEAPFWDLHLSIANGFVSSKIYDKRDDFDFDIVNFPFLDGDVPRRASYGVFITGARRLFFFFFFFAFSPVWRPLRYVHAIILPLKPFLSILNQPSSMGYYIDKVGNAVS